MSMILDALTRAERERQIEKQPHLKFVTPVRPRQKKSNNLWLWVVMSLLANAVVLAIFLRPDTGSNEVAEFANNSALNIQLVPVVQSSVQAPVTEEMVASKATPIRQLYDEAIVSNPPPTARPSAVELDSQPALALDRPLVYEAKQAKKLSPPNVVSKSHVIETYARRTSAKKGTVSFSQTELNIGHSVPPNSNVPKLLIDQGEIKPSAANAPSLKDLPDGTRSNLSQYEVNVHVFDDDPQRRFVLINMGKYKEGDHIANNGPLVEEITREGVIVDYGNGRALLPSK